MVNSDDTSPGWDAIDAALDRLYPGVEPMHFGTLIKWMLGGPDPLDGVSIYPLADHWHFISYGMSELYSKESDYADESGWGFEFTFRLARTPDESEPPTWAMNFLQNLARYVVSSANPFGPGHSIDLNGPIAQSRPDTRIRAAAFTTDPALGVIDTPHGQVRFLQVVGLTLDEYAAIKRWDTERMLAVLAPHLPLFVTDLDRTSLTDHADVAAAIDAGARRDGSATGLLYVENAGWRAETVAGRPLTIIALGASAAERVGLVLQGRLPFGNALVLRASEGGVTLQPGEQTTITDAGDGCLEVTIPPAVLKEIVGVLRPVAGTHHLASAPGLAVQIMKSQIRNQAGAIVEEIG